MNEITYNYMQFHIAIDAKMGGQNNVYENVVMINKELILNRPNFFIKTTNIGINCLIQNVW